MLVQVLHAHVLLPGAACGSAHPHSPGCLRHATSTAHPLALPACLLCPATLPAPACLVQYLVNVGWTSVWVKVVSQWVTVALYSWTLVAPTLMPDRDFS